MKLFPEKSPVTRTAHRAAMFLSLGFCADALNANESGRARIEQLQAIRDGLQQQIAKARGEDLEQNPQAEELSVVLDKGDSLLQSFEDLVAQYEKQDPKILDETDYKVLNALSTEILFKIGQYFKSLLEWESSVTTFPKSEASVAESRITGQNERLEALLKRMDTEMQKMTDAKK